MKSIEFNGKNYNVPQNWNEVTVGMLMKSSELANLLPDAQLIAIMSAYTGIPLKELRLKNKLKAIEIEQTMEFIYQPYEPVPETEFEFNNEKYSCAEQLTSQNFEDWVSLMTVQYNYKDTPVKALPKMLAILCKKDNETLTDFDLDERALEFESLPMTIAKDVEAFFLMNFHESNAITLLSSLTELQKEIVRSKIQELENILKIHKEHSGIFSSTRLHLGIYQLQLQWVKNQLEKYFNSEPLKV
jgi:hypothetical protein